MRLIVNALHHVCCFDPGTHRPFETDCCDIRHWILIHRGGTLSLRLHLFVYSLAHSAIRSVLYKTAPGAIHGLWPQFKIHNYGSNTVDSKITG